MKDCDKLMAAAVRLHRAQKTTHPKAKDLLSILIDFDFQLGDIEVKLGAIESLSIERENAEVTKNLKLDVETTDVSVSPNIDIIVDDKMNNEASAESAERKGLDVNETENVPVAVTTPEKQLSLTSALRSEHELLTQSTRCVSCKSRPREVTFLPCGHFCLCSTCSDTTTLCPICHREALAEVRTFLR